MSQGELLALYLAERLLRSLEGTPFESDLRGAIEKLGHDAAGWGLGQARRGDPCSWSCRRPGRAYHPAAVPRPDDGGRLPASAGDGLLDRESVMRRTGGPSTRMTWPCLEDGWYAIGHCHLRGEIRMFAVQRVRSVRATGETFDRPADFRVGDYSAGAVSGPSAATAITGSCSALRPRRRRPDRREGTATPVRPSSPNPTAA